MVALKLRERLRLWFLFSEGAALWPVILGVALVVGGLSAAAWYARTPTGPRTNQQVTIVGMGDSLSEIGNTPQAVVRLPEGRTITVTLYRTHRCQIGDQLVVSVRRARWGTSHTVRSQGCNT